MTAPLRNTALGYQTGHHLKESFPLWNITSTSAIEKSTRKQPIPTYLSKGSTAAAQSTWRRRNQPCRQRWCNRGMGANLIPQGSSAPTVMTWDFTSASIMITPKKNKGVIKSVVRNMTAAANYHHQPTIWLCPVHGHRGSTFLGFISPIIKEGQLYRPVAVVQKTSQLPGWNYGSPCSWTQHLHQGHKSCPADFRFL